MDRRDLEMIVGMADRYRFGEEIDDLREKCYLSKWKQVDDQHIGALSLSKLASALYAAVHRVDIGLIPQNGTGWATRIQDMQLECGNTTRLRDNLLTQLAKIRVLDDVGTADDYDMDLMHVVNLLYLLSHDRDLLPDKVQFFQAAKHMLCQDADGNGCEANPDERDEDMTWDGLPGTGYLMFGLDRDYYVTEHGDAVQFWNVETENHVLMIYTWNYLVSTWVIWHAMHDHASPWVVDWYHEGMTWLHQGDNMHRFYDNILQALGRVVHGGLFEVNARPYQEYTLLAILTLAIYADPFSAEPPADSEDWSNGYQADPMVEWYSKRVRQAARNALHYLAAKFAFQSLHAKRPSPFRRKHKYRKQSNFYQSNRAPFLFGLLSGAHEYDACTVDDPILCPLFNYPYLGGKSKLTWVALARRAAREDPGRDGYELPRAIQGHYFDQRPYFARFQPRSSRGQYERMTKDRIPYFDSHTEVNLPGEFRGFPELYFGTGDLMLAAGGMFNRFYNPETLTTEKDYQNQARPIMLMPRGDYGYPGRKHPDLPEAMRWFDLYDASSKDVLVMRGRRDKWWQSECNVWVYKSFAYGYNYDPAVEGDHAEKWAQYYPGWWEQQPSRFVKIEQAKFRIFQFGPGALWTGPGQQQSEPYYVIISWVGKDGRNNILKRWHYNYRRGFMEVVPGRLYANLDELEAELRAWHQPGFEYLTGGDHEDDKRWKYVTMTSHERLTLDPKMGAVSGLLLGLQLPRPARPSRGGGLRGSPHGDARLRSREKQQLPCVGAIGGRAAHLRPDRGQRGLVLGRQQRRPARRPGACDPRGGVGGWAGQRDPADHRGGSQHLRGRPRAAGLLLGLQLPRPARRRPAARARDPVLPRAGRLSVNAAERGPEAGGRRPEAGGEPFALWPPPGAPPGAPPAPAPRPPPAPARGRLAEGQSPAPGHHIPQVRRISAHPHLGCPIRPGGSGRAAAQAARQTGKVTDLICSGWPDSSRPSAMASITASPRPMRTFILRWPRML
jgi:hypothetical protein